MTGAPDNSLAAKQDFGFRPAPQRASRYFLGMHHLHTLAVALAMPVVGVAHADNKSTVETAKTSLFIYPSLITQSRIAADRRKYLRRKA